MSNRTLNIFIFLFASLSVPWVYILTQIVFDADSIWLTICAEHFLAGRAMADYYFETNPPMSIMMYVPTALMSMAGMSRHLAVDLYVIGVVAFSASVSALYLRHWDVGRPLKVLLIVGFILSVTLCATFQMGQRDHFTAAALLPFVLAQFSITYKYADHRFLRILTFALLCPFILVKPHYGLIPVGFLIHRFWRERRLSIVFDADFVVLSLGVLLYGAAMVFWFPDFLDTTLWASLDMYAGQKTPYSVLDKVMAFALLSGCLYVFIYASEGRDTQKTLLSLICSASVLSIVPFWVQNKAFTYHVLPYIALVFPVLFSVIWLYARHSSRAWMKPAYFSAVFIFLGLFVYAFNGMKVGVAHDILDEDPIYQLIEETAAGSSFYIEYSSTTAVLHIAEAQDKIYASRYPAMWAIPRPEMDEAKRVRYLNMAAKNFAEDVARYQPEIILLAANEDRNTLLYALQDYPAFMSVLKQYNKGDKISSENFLMMPGQHGEDDLLYEYWIYRRK